MDMMERISNENTETEDGSMNEEQESVIKKLEEALGFLKIAKIKNKESFANVKKPLEDFLSSLKYLPYEPPFEILPPEIKTGILGYLCDKEAFVAASVCQDWKDILFKTKLKNFKVVIIGKHCSKCEDNKCFMPEEILKASITLKVDIPLYICHPIPDVDTQVISEALTSVSKLIIDIGECICVGLGTWGQFQLKTATVKRIIENILTLPRATMYLRSLDILGQGFGWRELISPDNLEILLNKLTEVKLRGQFTPDQVEKARSVPGVEASTTLISKK